MDEILEARAKRYGEYLLGWAYIPLQELGKYEKAYKEVNEKKKSIKKHRYGKIIHEGINYYSLNYENNY